MDRINRKFLMAVAFATVIAIVVILIRAIKTSDSTADKTASAAPASLPFKIMFVAFMQGIQLYSPLTSEVQYVINSSERFYGLVRDPVNRKIYYSTRETLYRANEDGSEINLAFPDLDYGIIDGFAMDVAAGDLYATSREGYVLVCKAAAVGTLNFTTLLEGQRKLNGIAVNPHQRALYWTSSEPGQITKASMDDVEDRAVIVTGLNLPIGIFVDQDSYHLFWVDFSEHKIQSSNLDGSDVRDILQLPDRSWPWGIVVYGERIYWGTGVSKLLQSSSKSGQDIQTLYNGSGILEMVLIN